MAPVATPGARIPAKVPAHSTSDPLPATCAMKPRRPGQPGEAAQRAEPDVVPRSPTAAGLWAVQLTWVVVMAGSVVVADTH